VTGDVIERAWQILSRWAVPVMMTLAYAFLAATSETDTAGKAWMAVGLGFVLVVWFVFRTLTEAAALSRALAVGDVARLFALADRHLSRKRRPADQAPFLVARAFAHQLRGELAEALAVLEEACPGPELQPLASAVKIGALVELGRSAEARALVVTAPRAPALGWLTDGQIAWRDGEFDTASQLFARVIDDVRAGSATRAIAHVYAARIADARGDAQAAARHRAAAATLATPDATWLRGQGAPPVATVQA
jgi:tetratricopeptide (TPR) repeat protein